MTADVLLDIASHGLRSSLHRLMERPLNSDAWESLAASIDQSNLSTFAVAASRAGELLLTDEQEEDLLRRAARACQRCQVAAETLDEVVTTLNRESINSCVLHGAAASELDYPLPNRRLYDSIDLLVAPSEFDDAISLLEKEDISQASAHRTKLRRRRDVQHLRANGVDLCLHSSLTAGRFGGPFETRDLLASRTGFPRRDVRLCALGVEERLIVACIHSRIDRSNSDILAQRDVVQLVLREDLSIRKLERLASSWHMEALLADAVSRAWDAFAVHDVVPLSAWSGSYWPQRRDKRRLAALPRATAKPTRAVSRPECAHS